MIQEIRTQDSGLRTKGKGLRTKLSLNSCIMYYYLD